MTQNIICPHCGAVSVHPGAQPAKASAHGVDLPMGAALNCIYGGVDPALAKIDMEARHAKPQPASARQALAAVRARTVAQRIETVTTAPKPQSGESS